MSLSLAPDAPSDERLAAFERHNAFSTLEDLAEDTLQGASASLIYVEGDVALYLDNDDTPDALEELEDRDLVLMEALVNLASERVVRERRRRNQHPSLGGEINRIAGRLG